MASLNECSFIGNLGADPDIKTFQDGGRIANFSIACTDKWKDRNSGEVKERTEWVRIVVKQDALVGVVKEYLKKGSKVYITGQMQTRKYEKDGRDVYTTEIVLQGFNSKLIMLDGRNNSDGGGENRGGDGRTQTERPQASRPAQSTIDSDDIPF